MSSIREALAGLAEKLGLSQSLLAHAQRRYLANRRRAYVAHNQQVEAQKLADRARSAGDPTQAAKHDKEAMRRSHVAFKNHARAQHFLGVTKALQQRINDLETNHAKLAAELKKANKVTVRGDKVAGSTRRARLRVAIHTAAQNCAAGTQHNYYSMTGLLPLLSKTLLGMPYGHRFDCSSFATGIYFVCDCPDPNGGDYAAGETMYTGSLTQHGKRVDESDAKTGDLVIYLRYWGDTTGHHVEVVDDPAAKTTIGHGSAPIDQGVFDLFGDGLFEIRSYV